MTTLLTVLSYALAVLAGGITALKIIAPKTKTTADDRALVYLEDVYDLLVKLGLDKPAADAHAAALPTVAAAK